MRMTKTQFIPALGYRSLTPAYDYIVRVATRERAWRRRLFDQLALENGQSLLDVGCGTGTFAILCKQQRPGARVVGMDPDPEVLAIAQRKAVRAGVEVDWRLGYAQDASRDAGAFDKAVSTLMFHQLDCEDKRLGLEAMLAAVRTGGEIHIADYCRQPDTLMRGLFRIVQTLDGYQTTQPNADGVIEGLLASRAGVPVHPMAVVRTPTGAISLFRLPKHSVMS